jgi:hypothetical protein
LPNALIASLRAVRQADLAEWQRARERGRRVEHDDLVVGDESDAGRVVEQRSDRSIAVVSSQSDLTRWQEKESLDSVVIVRPQVGFPVNDLNSWVSSLVTSETSVGVLHRRWDHELFPLCSKGFFTMWERFQKRWATKASLSGLVGAGPGTPQ